MPIPGWLGVHHCSAGRRYLIPDAERTRSEQPVVNRSEQVTADTKEILHGSVHRKKSLGVCSGLEAPHLTLALAGRLVRNLRTIVLVLPRAVHHRRHHGAVRGGVAA